MYQAPDLFPTTVVGSYPQPDWLVDRHFLRTSHVPRVRTPDLWRIPGEYLEEAQDDATILAIREMENAGIDIITDGEIRRESYSSRFALSLEGVTADPPGEIIGRTGVLIKVPRVIRRIRRQGAVEVRDADFLRRNTTRLTKITLPGPFTMAQQCKNEIYEDTEELAMDYAAAVNEELLDLKQTGVDVLQLDEPWLQARPEEASRYALPVLNRALRGVPGPTVIHLCFGYAHVVRNKPSGYSFLPQLSETSASQISIEAAQPKLDLAVLREIRNKAIVLGVIDLGTMVNETPDEVADRIDKATAYVEPTMIIPAPDCGMKYLPRDVAAGKLRALADGAALARGNRTG
jgi:5-methyltetrahydropteroyltriglutamate--homocysteine methyltransferase